MRLTAAGITAVLDGHEIVSSAGLEVGEAEVVGLVGPNGSGKSTLLRCIYRVLRPHAGLVGVDGDDVWKLTARAAARRTAVVVQEPPSDFDFAVRDMVMLGRAPHLGLLERGTETDDRIVDDALASVGATVFADRGFRTLSGGEKQRVLLARALAQQPRLLVLDEPTNHLDVRHQLEVLQLVVSSASPPSPRCTTSTSPPPTATASTCSRRETWWLPGGRKTSSPRSWCAPCSEWVPCDRCTRSPARRSSPSTRRANRVGDDLGLRTPNGRVRTSDSRVRSWRSRAAGCIRTLAAMSGRLIMSWSFPGPPHA